MFLQLYTGCWERKEPGVDWMIIRIIKENSGRFGMDLSGSGQGQVTGSCESCNGHSDLIKCRVFVEKLRNYQLFKKNCITN